MKRALAGVLFIGLVAGCDDLELADVNMGVGTTLPISASDCSVLCTSGIVEIIRVLDKVPGIFSIEATGAQSFVLTALAVGETDVAVAAVDDDSEVHISRARFKATPVVHMDLEVEACDRYQVPGTTPLLERSGEFVFAWAIFAENGDVLDGYPVFAGAEVASIAPSAVTLRMPDAEATIITSLADPTLSFSANLFAPAEVDGVLIGDVFPGPSPLRFEKTIEAVPTVGGVVPCRENVERLLTITTPDVCNFLPRDSGMIELVTTDAKVDVVGIAPGLCEITAAIGAATASFAFEVLDEQ